MRLALLISLLLAPLMAHAEPVTTAVAAFVAWASTLSATVYLVAATVTLSVGIAVYGSAQARRAERAARDAANAELQDRMVTRIATEAPHRYIYGRCKVGSDIVAMFTSGDRDQYKHLVCVHAAHECDAIEEVFVNNEAVGLRDANGDPTGGRYATDPYSDVVEESHSGPTFTLNRFPRPGKIWVFSGYGAEMTPVTITTVSGRNVTIDYSGDVTVSYEYSVPRRFGDNVDPTVQVTSNPVVRVQVHLGTPDDPADAYLMSVVPDKWKDTAVLRGKCYTVVTLDLNHPEFQSGQVPIHAQIRGRKLYDPRTGETKWSENVALAIYDYLTSPLCGVPASDLPVDQFITAANVCDETDVPGGRYTINGAITSDQTQESVLEKMAQAMAGGIVSTTWSVYAGKYVAPVAALTQDDIVGALSITPGASDATIYNGVKGQYISDETKNVLTDYTPYQNATYRAADGRDLYTNIDFPFTNSVQRVHNIARIFTEDQRNGFTIKAEFSLKAWPRKVGQRVTFTSAFLGQTNKVYRITDRRFSPNSAVELTLKEDDPSIWDFADATTVDSTPNTDLPDPWAVAPLASLDCTSGEATLLRQADGSMVPRILASWPAAATQAVFTNGEIEVEWRAVSSETWSRTSASGSDTQAYLAPITPGFFYTVRARCVNPYLNTYSDWITTTYQVAVFTANPTVYKWSAGVPAAPTGSAAYNWADGTFGAAPADWSLTQPDAPASGGVSLYAAGARVSDISVNGTSPFDWSAAVLSVIAHVATPNYTWIKYATSAAGDNLSDDPTGKTYIGMAYNKTTATESTNAVDYTWSLIQGPQGDQGVPGAPGTDGTTTYTWIKYSDNADGTGLYDAPTASTQYIGIATNKTTASESNNAADYTWSKFKGDQGVEGPQGVQGPPGADGAPTYTWIKYSDNADGTGLYDTPTASTQYIGIATNKTVAAESTDKADYVWSKFKGDQGVQGPQGTDGITTYTWIKYADSASGDGLSDSPTGKAYIGFAYNKTTASESTNAADYMWSLIQGGGNLIDLSWWKRIANIPWPVNGEFNVIGSSLGDYNIAGPKGGSEDVWLCKETTGDGNQGGGWENVAITLDPDKTYRFVVPVFKASGAGGAAYWGLRNVCDLNTTTVHADNNPYFASSNGLPNDSLPIGRWHLFVGYVFPANSTNHTHDGAGVYDCTTGVLVRGGTNWTFKPGDGAVAHRAYQFYAPLNSEQLFGRPMINVVDGSEPSLLEYFGVVQTLNNIASDSVLSKGEKAQVILDWTAIADAKQGIDDQADSLGVSYSDHDAKYQALGDYLSAMFPYWNDTTQDTSIDGPTFRSKFSDYYTARQSLLNAVAAKAAMVAQWSNVTNRPEDVSNLVRKSNFDDGARGLWQGQGIEAKSGVNNEALPYKNQLVTHSRDNLESGNVFNVTAGETIYFAAWLNADASTYTCGFGAFIFKLDGSVNQYAIPCTVPAGQGWTYVEGSVVVSAGGVSASPWLWMDGYDFSTGNWLRVAGMWIGRHARGATVGAQSGTNLYDQNGKLVTDLSMVSATIGTLRTAPSGARTELRDNVFKVYDGSNVMRVKIGDLSL